MNLIFQCNCKHLRRHYRPLHLTLSVCGTGKNGYDDDSGGAAADGDSAIFGGDVCAVAVMAVLVVLKQSKLLTAKFENRRN